MRAVIALLVAVVVASVSAIPTLQPEPSCKRLTAGWSSGRNKFLFFGRTYVSLDDDLKQFGTGSSYEQIGISWPDAAFRWPVDGVDYVFSDKYYFSSWTNYSPVDAWMFGGRSHGKFFANGLDAAGSVNGTTLFFKGCYYVASLPNGPSDPTPINGAIPCEVDAGLTVGEDLYLFKYNQMWKLTPQGLAAGMPVDTSSVITLDGITLCPPPWQ